MPENLIAQEVINGTEEDFRKLTLEEQDLLGRYIGAFGYNHDDVQLIAQDLDISTREVEERVHEIFKKFSRSTNRTTRHA